MSVLEHERLHGSDAQVGAELGRTASDGMLLRRAVAARLTRDQRRFLDESLTAIAAHAPRSYEQLAEMANGARVDLRTVLLMQAFRELDLLATRMPASDCTTIARGAMVAQTIDLPAVFAGQFHVSHQVIPGQPAVLCLAPCGLVGYLGMNDAGIAIGINVLEGGGVKPGIPPYVLVRECLRHRSVKDCLELLRRAPRSSARALTIAGPDGLVEVEMTVDAFSATSADSCAHANHFQHDALRAFERSRQSARWSSHRRLEAAHGLLGELSTGSKLEDVLSAMGDHERGICHHAGGSQHSPVTLLAVLMNAQAGHMLVSEGPPCEGGFRRLSFDGAAHELAVEPTSRSVDRAGVLRTFLSGALGCSEQQIEALRARPLKLIGMTSLKLIGLMDLLEDTYGVVLPDEVLADPSRLTVAWIEEQIDRGGGALIQ